MAPAAISNEHALSSVRPSGSPEGLKNLLKEIR
jgi:hypothetical protein